MTKPVPRACRPNLPNHRRAILDAVTRDPSGLESEPSSRRLRAATCAGIAPTNLPESNPSVGGRRDQEAIGADLPKTTGPSCRNGSPTGFARCRIPKPRRLVLGRRNHGSTIRTESSIQDCPVADNGSPTPLGCRDPRFGAVVEGGDKADSRPDYATERTSSS